MKKRNQPTQHDNERAFLIAQENSLDVAKEEQEENEPPLDSSNQSLSSEQPPAEDEQEEAPEEEALSAEDLEALEATAAGAGDAGGYDLPMIILYGGFALPDSLPQTLEIPPFSGTLPEEYTDFAPREISDSVPVAIDDIQMDFEPMRTACNLVLAFDVSGSMSGDQFELAKKTGIEILEKYDTLNIPLNLTVIPFSSSFLFRAAFSEFFGGNVEDAKDYIDQLQIGESYLGTSTEYDDVVRELQDTLEYQIDNLPDDYHHKVYFLSDAANGNPSDPISSSLEDAWQSFIADNDINVVPVVFKPEVSDAQVLQEYEKIMNPGDNILNIGNSNEIDDVLIQNLAAPAIHFEGDNLLDNDILGTDLPVILTSICVNVESMADAQFYADQIPGSSITPQSAGYQVTLPVSGATQINTLLGGQFTVNPQGDYSYWGPQSNIPPSDLSEVFCYTIQDSNGDTSTANVTFLLKDTVPEAFDNANWILASTSGMVVISDFNTGFEGWDLPYDGGHDHIIDETAFLSTLWYQHGSGENPVSENTLANYLNLSGSTLDDARPGNAEYGSGMWQDLMLSPGDEILFDFNFATNDRGRSDEWDYAFLSISGQGQEEVYVFADVFHPDLYNSGNSLYLDSTQWDDTTGWHSDQFALPLDWAQGTYRVGFGVVDVEDGRDADFESSMLQLDNIKINEGPEVVEGNVILDPNTYAQSLDPIGATDILRADGGKVRLLSFEVDSDPNDYINDNNLGSMGAYVEDGAVVVPIPLDGTFAQMPTPLGGTLFMNENGEYRYFSAEDVGPVEEKFTYHLVDWDGSADDALLVIKTLNPNVMKMEVENQRPCCNVVFAIDISSSINTQEPNLAKMAALAVIQKLDALDYKLNFTIIPFAAGSLEQDTRDGARVYRATDVDDATNFINNLSPGYEGLGNNTEYDDALNVARDVLEQDLINLPDFEHKLYFLSDGKPTDGQEANSSWQTFITDQNIDVIPTIIDTGYVTNSQRNETAKAGNPGDELVIIANDGDIETKLVDQIPIPDLSVHFDNCWILGGVNETMEGPYEVKGISFNFHEDDVPPSKLSDLLDDYNTLGATITQNGDQYEVYIEVPENLMLSFTTPALGMLMINQEGIVSYWGPNKSFEEDFSESFQYHFDDPNDAHGPIEAPLVFVIKDTAPTAYDNANYTSLSELESTTLAHFNTGSDFAMWDKTNVSGNTSHEHPIDDAAFLSTLWYQHSSHDDPTDENTLASALGLSNSILDNTGRGNAQYGSAIWKDIYFNPGDHISFDAFFGTNDRGRGSENDFAFVSLAGLGEQWIDVFADVYHPDLYDYGNSAYIDSVSWDDTTGWFNYEIIVPESWQAGTYRLGFGVMDVNDGRDNSTNESSMLMIDDVIVQTPIYTTVEGNVVLDPNSDVFSGDPIGVQDEILSDGAKVTLISFDAKEDGDDYISDHGLGALGATAQGDIVHIPVPIDGTSIAFDTVEGGHFSIDQFGNYAYQAPVEASAPFEQLQYTLFEWDGNDEDTANLTLYFNSDKNPDYHIMNGIDSKQYVFSMEDAPISVSISGLDDQDVIFLTDVTEGSPPPGLDIDDAILEASQNGDDVIARLANDSLVLFEDLGPLPIAATPGQAVETLLTEEGVSMNISA